MRGLWRRLRELLHKGRLDREAADELEQHVEMAVAEKVARGIDEAEARRRARLELGHPEEARELLREGRAGSGLDGLAQDTAYAVRILRKRPGFSALCSLTIALGVGASTALFALVHTVVLKPLPFPAPERLVRIFDTNPEANIERTGATSGNLADWRRNARAFSGIAGYYSMGRTLASTPRPPRRAPTPSWCWDMASGNNASAEIRRSWDGPSPWSGGPSAWWASCPAGSRCRSPRSRCGFPGTSPEITPATSTTWAPWPGWPTA
jgi:hypothetical protein